MQRVDLAPFRREPERPRRDADHRGRVAEVEPGLDAIFRRATDRDPVARPQRGHPFPGPAVPVPGPEPVAIEKAGDGSILDGESEHAHRLDDVGRRAVALPAPTSRQPVLGVGAARPVDDDDDPGGRVVAATASRMTVRTMRFFSRASVVGAVQTASRSSARAPKEIGSRAGRRGAAAS
jgi:hypothetical protein